MAAYRHLVSDPVFGCDGLLYLRAGDKPAVVLRHGNRTPVAGFLGAWRPVFVYTGLAGMLLLALEENGARATWIVAPDGRRLGDKLTDLEPRQRAGLRDAAIAKGLADPNGLADDEIQLIEPGLLAALVRLAREPAAKPLAAWRPEQTGLAMIGAPRGLHLQLQFRPGDDTAAFGEGWAEEQAGSCRATGQNSVIEAGMLPAASRHLLLLDLAPADSTEAALAVGIEIQVNDRVIGATSLDPKWQREGADLAFWLPPELVGERPLRIVFRHGGDFRFSGMKLLAGPPARAETPDPREVMLQFENLGDNCEFGLVQRHFGADPVGLLRFAGLRDPRRLIRFLDDDFGRYGEPGSLAANLVGGEYWIFDHVYGIASHTFRYQHEAGADEVVRENEAKAVYLKRKFREDLEDGEKIFVYKRVVTQDPAEMLALHLSLNRSGTVNKLLWVTEADGSHAPGDVEWVGDRLLKGYVGAISLTNAHQFDPETWLLLCRNALAAFGAVS